MITWKNLEEPCFWQPCDLKSSDRLESLPLLSSFNSTLMSLCLFQFPTDDFHPYLQRSTPQLLCAFCNSSTPSHTPLSFVLKYSASFTPPSHSLFLTTQILNPFSWCEIKLCYFSIWTFKSYFSKQPPSPITVIILGHDVTISCSFLNWPRLHSPSPSQPSQSPASIAYKCLSAPCHIRWWCPCLAFCSSTAHPMKIVPCLPGTARCFQMTTLLVRFYKYLPNKYFPGHCVCRHQCPHTLGQLASEAILN